MTGLHQLWLPILMLPRPATRADMQSAAFAETLRNGPVMVLTVWYRRTWSTTLKATVDGLLYALLTAGTFGWLWPR